MDSASEPARGDTVAKDLAVDLDGTLLRSDSLHEGLVRAFFRKPLDALAAVVSLFRGRAKFKARLAEHSSAAVGHSPENPEFLAWLREEAARGRRLHLVSAADQEVVSAVAARFQIFDQAIGTVGGRNLKGPAKRDRLVAEFPDGFSYAGDSHADLHVFAAAQTIVLAGAAPGLARKARALGRPVEAEFPRPRRSARTWGKAMRLHQWSKNLLMFVPLLLSGTLFSVDAVGRTVAGFLLMGLAASGSYILNDLADLESDRRHWSKSARPFASGAISPLAGLAAAMALIGGGLIGAWLLSPAFSAVLAGYLAITLSYSFYLKRVALLDVALLATLYGMRLAMGAVLAGVVLSQWLMVFAFFFFLSLSMAKRYVEILRAAEVHTGLIPGRGYDVRDAGLILAFGLSAAMTSLLVLILFLVFEAFIQTYAHPDWLWAAPALIFLWLCRIWLLASRSQLEDDPVSFAVKDGVSLALGALLGFCVLMAILPGISG
jgi:4-hydroxybenzoate polyprenyltransferase/phosphoserine phosphatase